MQHALVQSRREVVYVVSSRLFVPCCSWDKHFSVHTLSSRQSIFLQQVNAAIMGSSLFKRKACFSTPQILAHIWGCSVVKGKEHLYFEPQIFLQLWAVGRMTTSRLKNQLTSQLGEQVSLLITPVWKLTVPIQRHLAGKHYSAYNLLCTFSPSNIPKTVSSQQILVSFLQILSRGIVFIPL